VPQLGARLGSGHDSGYGWVVVATLGVTEIVSYGALTYAFAVLLGPIHDATG
jgi:hypothetical protein